MINLESEGLIRLGPAGKLVPSRRTGGATSAETVKRWIRQGFRGVKLEGLLTPSGWVTSAPAVQRFLAKLSGLDVADVGPTRKQLDDARTRKEWARDFWAKLGVTVGGG